jgi:aspartate ammonia-lyase
LETDSLGSVEVPADALYGARTFRALGNLSFSDRSLGNCPEYLAALGAVKRAAARANREAGVLQPDLAGAIEAAAARMLDADLRGHFPVDLLGGGGSIGVHVNVNEVLANVANEMKGGRRGEYTPVRPVDVGASQSTADVCHTALRLAILSAWPALSSSLNATRATLLRKAAELAGIETMARTCLRDAMTVSLGVLLGGYAALIDRRTRALQDCIDSLRAVSLGGTVIGTGEGAPPLYRERIVPILAQVVGLELVRRECLSDALQNSDDVAAVSTSLLAGGSVDRDRRRFARYLRSARRVQRSSAAGRAATFLPKIQPVVPETVIQCGFQVLGCDRAVQAANEHGELYLNVFDGLAAVNVRESLAMLARAVALLEARCLRELSADVERCAELVRLTHGK